MTTQTTTAAIKPPVVPTCSHRQFASAFLMFPGDLELDALFEDHGMSCTVIEGMLTLERAVYQRCTLGQLPLCQAYRSSTDESVFASCCPAVLPPHIENSALQLLDFVHKRSENETTTFTSSAFSPDCRSLHVHQNRSKVATGTSVLSPASRSARGNRRTPRQAPAPQRTDHAHGVDSAVRYTYRVSHLGRSPQ